MGDRLWSAHLIGLQAVIPDAAFAPASPVIGRLRAVKDEDELAALRRAGRAADETFRQICGMTFLGRREEEIAADLADLLVRNGHARADFTIVASGPNSASPHHEPTGRTMLPRDAVVLDFGGELAGYFSDTTRTVVVGEAPEGFEEVYRVVQEAQEAAFRAVRPGVEAQAIDRVARDDHRRCGLRRAVHPSHGPRDRARGPRAALPGRGERLGARARHDVLDRARGLPGGAVRRADRGHRRGHGRRSGAPESVDPGAPGRRLTELSRAGGPSCPRPCP